MTENVNENFLSYEWWKTATIDDVKAEIKKGADINARAGYIALGMTPLMHAVRDNESPEVIRMLVKLGADVNAKEYVVKTTPLMYAAYNKNPEVIRTLVELGADIDAKDYEGKNAMYYAKEKGNSKVIKLLDEYWKN